MELSTALAHTGLFVAGMGFWTVLEWVMHNYLGHHGKGKNPFAREHIRHHATTHYFAPSWKKAALAVPVAILVWLAIGTALGRPSAAAFTGGLFSMYFSYEFIHRRIHTHPPTGPYTRWARLNHFHHHFRSPKSNHGVSSPFWDKVFGTYEKPVLPLRIPEKHLRQWMVDGQGEVHPHLAGDYVIARRGQRPAAGQPETITEPPAAIEGVSVQL